MTYSFVKASVNEQSDEQTQLVMVYQLGNVFDCLLNREGDLKGFMAYAQTETADFISMCRMLCEQKEWNFEELCKDDQDVELPTGRTEQLGRSFIILSKVVRGLYHTMRFGNPHGENPEKYMKDLIHWVRRLCTQMGWDFWEVIEMGEKRYEDRMEDLRKHGINKRLKPQYRRKAVANKA